MELVLMMGLQGSGKSTFARQRFEATHRYISRDLLTGKNHASKEQLLIEEALQQGLSVVVDDTNPTREVRAELIAIGNRYAAEIAGYFFVVQVERCLERNRGRKGKARVPDVAIFATLKRLARPSYAEGFTNLFSVYNNDTRDFDVAEWQD